MSWGTHGGHRGRVQLLTTTSFVTNAVHDRKSCELLTSASANLADYTILAYLALRFGSRGGHVPQGPVAGDVFASLLPSLSLLLSVLASLLVSLNNCVYCVAQFFLCLQCPLISSQSILYVSQ